MIDRPRVPRTTDRLPISTYLLALAQALNLTAAVLSVTVAALIGVKLAPDASWATVPYGVQFAMVMLCTYPAAMMMRKCGRRVGFTAGAVMLMLAGLIGYASVTHRSFAGLVLAHGFLGVYIACANFYRFAAADNVPLPQRARALSLVVSGGVLAAFLGPLLSTLLREVPGHAEFAMSYAALCGLSVLTGVILMLWRPAAASEPTAGPSARASGKLAFKGNGLVVLGIGAAAVGYFAMNLLMIQSSLVMSTFCTFNASSLAIQGHVLAMFVPSFFTGPLIARIGIRRVIGLGFGLLAASAGVALFQPLSYAAMVTGLLLLGAGWNFAYVGGGTLVAERAPSAQRHAWQGANDTAIAACATLGAFMPAPWLAWFGWAGSNAWVLALCLATGAICWFGLRRGNVRPGVAVEGR